MQRSIVADLPNSQLGDEDIGRTCLPCFRTQAALGFELCTQACTLTKLEKGVSDSAVAGNRIGASQRKVIQRMGHVLGTKLTLTHRKA